MTTSTYRLLTTSAGLTALIALVLSIIALASTSTSKGLPPITQDHPAAYTVALVDRAILHYKAHGRAETVAHYNNPDNAHGEWYVFIVDHGNKTILAHVDPSLVGRKMRDQGSDLDGTNLADLPFSQKGRWFHYEFENPLTGEPSIKHSWALLYDDLLIGSGWYE